MQKAVQLKMIMVNDAYSGNCWLFEDIDSAKCFISAAATQDNCGLFRHWCIDGIHHYDCGRSTYTCAEKLFSFQ